MRLNWGKMVVERDSFWQLRAALVQIFLKILITIKRAPATYADETMMYESTNSTARLSRKYSSSVLSRERIL